MSSSKKEDVAKFLIIGFFRLLWWLTKKIYYSCMSHHMQIAPSKEKVEAFYKSRGWYKLSAWAKDHYGKECMKCKKNPIAFVGLKLNTDHIRPVWYYWHLRKDKNNLQVLCAACNKAKGSVEMTDYRDYRPGKTPMPQSMPVPRRRFQIADTTHAAQRGWLA